nr:hypothetical protein DM860_011449 [Ipomoea batatas]
MATAITNMRGALLPYPSHGRLWIRRITRVTMTGSSGASFTLRDNWFEIHFNPLFHLSSLGTAFSFFLDRHTALGADIIFRIAAFAFDLVRSRNWFYGVSLSVVLETDVYVLEEPSADFLDGEMILNEDTAAVRDYYDEPFASTGHGNVGMSQQEISMLKTERLSDDDEEDGECCSICLERFMRGMIPKNIAAINAQRIKFLKNFHKIAPVEDILISKIEQFGSGAKRLNPATELKALADSAGGYKQKHGRQELGLASPKRLSNPQADLLSP